MLLYISAIFPGTSLYFIISIHIPALLLCYSTMGWVLYAITFMYIELLLYVMTYIYIYIYIYYIYIYIYNYYRSKIFHYGCGFVRYARSLHTYFQGHTALLGLFWHLRSPFSPHIPVALPGDALSQDPEGQLWLSCRILGGRVGERQGYDQGHAPSWC